MLLLRGGRILDPSQNLDETGDVLLVDGEDRGGRPRSARCAATATSSRRSTAPGCIVVSRVHRRALPSARARTRGRGDDRDRCARRGRGRLHRGLRDAEHRPRHRQPGGGRLRPPAGASRRGGARLSDRRHLHRPEGRDARRVRRDGRRRRGRGERRRQAGRERAADAHGARVRANLRHSGRRPLRGADARRTAAR